MSEHLVLTLASETDADIFQFKHRHAPFLPATAVSAAYIRPLFHQQLGIGIGCMVKNVLEIALVHHKPLIEDYDPVATREIAFKSWEIKTIAVWCSCLIRSNSSRISN